MIMDTLRSFSVPYMWLTRSQENCSISTVPLAAICPQGQWTLLNITLELLLIQTHPKAGSGAFLETSTYINGWLYCFTWMSLVLVGWLGKAENGGGSGHKERLDQNQARTLQKLKTWSNNQRHPIYQKCFQAILLKFLQPVRSMFPLFPWSMALFELGGLLDILSFRWLLLFQFLFL